MQIAVLGSYDEENGKIDKEILKQNLDSIEGIKNVPEVISILPITVNVDGYDITVKENGEVVLEEESTGGNTGEEPENPEEPEEPENIYVARIGEIQYESLTSALNTITSGSTKVEIVLLKNTEENITIAQDTDIILNLNNHTLNNKENSNTITVNGTLLLKDGTVKGIYTEKVATINIAKTGICDIENANIDRESTVGWETIQLYGTINVNSGSIHSPNSNAICTYQLDSGNTTISIRGGEITANSNIPIYNDTSGKLYIYEGAKLSGINNSANSPVIQNKGYTEINGGEIINSGMGVLNYGGDMLINGGTITSEGTNGIPLYNTLSGTLTVNNATLTSKQWMASYNIEKAITTINNVTIYSSYYAVYADNAKITINSGSISRTSGSGATLFHSCYANYDSIFVSSKVNLNGGKLGYATLID